MSIVLGPIAGIVLVSVFGPSRLVTKTMTLCFLFFGGSSVVGVLELESKLDACHQLMDDQRYLEICSPILLGRLHLRFWPCGAAKVMMMISSPTLAWGLF